ncbi:TIGR01777 family oxidoreductase [Enterovibrio coralii]|uniref:Epimerase n=1 Tax=Enterovibrio coralii TaxID=294935 RepID=A0A135I344_9GAMM|nr:TIGR01777 family oxidoreductase [Enterovibrio coralii]KXF79869.1 epimerase [Enterovibrio coralii]
MHILITGGTGLIGRALIDKLSDHEITLLTRSESKARSLFSRQLNCISNLDDLPDFNAIDAVINLAGEPIVDKRWSDQQKGIICSSRWGITEHLVKKILEADNPPHTFISGSAVGIYGDQGDKVIDETFVSDASDFAHSVCENWEKIAVRAKAAQTRVCLLRTGIVLSKEGGALKKMLLPYQLGLGGPIGAGKQYFPWIHIDDMVGGILYLLNTESANGAFNLTAPNPVTNKTFSEALAGALHRPHILFTPPFAIKLMLGEAGQLLLEGQRVVPKALLDSGYAFQFSEIRPALDNIFAN